MVLEGVVTNVAAFGAFVDVGVHQDGLVHISAMAHVYVKDPRKITKPGDVVRVKVLEVDPKRRRISLTMRLDQAPEARPTTARAEVAPTRRINVFDPPRYEQAEAIPCPLAAMRWPRRFDERGELDPVEANDAAGEEVPDLVGRRRYPRLVETDGSACSRDGRAP
jgi:protein Tex